jgi:hypothetical protein
MCTVVTIDIVVFALVCLIVLSGDLIDQFSLPSIIFKTVMAELQLWRRRRGIL